jgi:hypothetical protein
MNSNTISYAIPPEAIRVFVGFPNALLTEPQFFAQLGQTFMPGTPYMLQPLGIAAYLPGVLSNPATNLPHEFALICYASADVWDKSMHGTLRGRLYNQTHGGVYAMPPSGAAFPVRADRLPDSAVDPYYLFPILTDWQTGCTKVAVAGRPAAMTDPVQFRSSLRRRLVAQTVAFAAENIDQVIVTASDHYAVLWFHSPGDDFNLDLGSLQDLLANPTTLHNQRIICIDEPPTLNMTTSSAFNFIFLREPKYFQR